MRCEMVEPVHPPFMDLCLELAAQAAREGEVPVGSVVVHEGVVIGRGYNRREQDQDPTAHAELLAMREAARALGSWRLDDCTVYVTLEPCAMCAGLMVNARVARCVYGCTDPKGGFLGSLDNLSQRPPLNHAFEVVAGVRESECREALVSFFRALRRSKS